MSELTDPIAEDTPVTTDQVEPAIDAPAVDSGTSEPTPEAALDAPFSLEDVDESYRSDVERYAKQLQGAYTRKTQSLADERAELKQLKTLQGELYSDDPEKRDAALSTLLDDLGYEIDGNEAPEGDYEEYVDPVDELKARIDRMETEKVTQQAEQQELDAVEAQVTFAEQSLTAYEQKTPLTETARLAIVTYAGSLPRQENGLPDMESAIALWESDRAEAVEGYLKTKRNAEPAPDLSGSTGTDQVNLSSRANRLQAAEAAAERAIAKHA